MTPDRWQTVKRIFHDVSELSGEERLHLIHRACADDAELQAEVESLLAAHDRSAGHFDAVPEQQLLDVLATAQVDPWIGARVGSYRIVERLGSGGMGTVYKADRDDDQYRAAVAIKLMRAESAAIAEWRFKAERQILAGLEHRNIARLQDGGTVGDTPYVVMELVQGEAIDRYCENRQLGVEDRVRLFLQVCAAVQYAHQRLIVHRDLKPSNILVTADGTVKLLDFGIAKLLQPETIDGALARDETATTLRVMTVEYASPEQISGAAITTASDIYSLGVLLYRLLARQSPYRSAKDDTARMAEVLTAEPPTRPSAAVTDNRHLSRALQGDLDNIVLLAMRKAPQERYAGVEQLATDLRSYLAGKPVLARGDSFRYRATKFIARHRYAVAASVLFVVALLAGIVATAWQARVAAEQSRIAQEEARKQRAVQSFLTALFDKNTRQQPDAAAARSMTVRELLIAASDRVANEFNDTPAVKMEVLNTVAGLLIDINEFDRAAALSRLAIRTGRQFELARSDAYIAALIALNNSARLLGLADEAIAARDEALARLDARNDHDSLLRARALGATVAQFAADPAREISLVSAAAELFARKYPRDPGHFSALYTLAHLYRTKGDNEEAVRRFHQAIAAFQAYGFRDYTNFGSSYAWAGYCEAQLGRLDAALRDYQTGIQLLRQHAGSQSIFTRIQLSLFAQVLYQAGRLQDADALVAELLTPEALAKPSAVEFDTTVYRAAAYLDEGRPCAALRSTDLFAASWLEFGKRFVPNGVTWLGLRARAQAACGKAKEARATLALADRLPRQYGLAPSELSEYLVNAAALYLQLGDIEAALSAVATVTAEPPATFEPYFIQASSIQAEALVAKGLPIQAKRVVDLAFESLGHADSEAFPFLRAQLLYARGAVEAAVDENSTAQLNLSAAVELMRRYQAPDSTALQTAIKSLRAVK